MATGATPSPGAIAVERAKQVFRFLRAFAEKGAIGKRQVAEHHWTQWMRQLPVFPSIVVGEVQLSSAADGGAAADAQVDQALITVRRPKLTKAPEPPDTILDFLQPGWGDLEKGIEILQARNVVRNGQTLTVRFDAVAERVHALENWRATWNAWAEAERPARRAMHVFERFYELKGRIDRESERVELVLGDGRLRWSNGDGNMDHPIVLQRVELLFDADVPEFRVVDTDRAPELYGTVLMGGESLSGDQLSALRSELEKGGYHPLARDGTSGFLKRVVQMLAPNGLFDAAAVDRAITDQPVITRDSVLFLRDRASGFPAAFDRVLEDLEARGEVPISLTQLVGVQPPIPTNPGVGEWSPWGEPPDVLLSKPANEEQVRIARALERHRAVLVQGPPGTGKSHTIANLIGHLVANGKRVLVTSHTTKALRVLRGHVVDTLKPLCVALLENDMEGRTQMEEAVKGILSRLTTSSEDTLEREVVQLAEDRSALNREVQSITHDLRTARESEYTPIVLGGESIPPSDAARWTRDNRQGNDWIPAGVVAGAPLPLSDSELTELYGTNTNVSRDEEEEIERGIPAIESVPSLDEFRALVAAFGTTEPPDFAALWERPGLEKELVVIQRLHDLVVSAAEDLGRKEKWQRAIVAAGHAGGSGAVLWREMATIVGEADALLERARPHFIQHDPQLPPVRSPVDVVRLSREIETHIEKGGSLSTFALLLHGDWRAFLRGARCNGHAPTTIDELRALRARAELDQSRINLGVRWQRQAEPVGLPAFNQFGEDPEPKLSEYTKQLDGLLAWWNAEWSPIAAAANAAGFRWEAFRAREVARSAPVTPFERDAAIVSGPLMEALALRLAICRRAVAVRRLNEFEALLAPFTGARSKALLEAVCNRDDDAYEIAHEQLRFLLAKVPLVKRRKLLLDRIQPVAPAWASAIRVRLIGHDGETLLGDAKLAWRWIQLHQELDRRSVLDEGTLTDKLHQCRSELRELTATLIDRRAWLGQIRRIDLPARQALQGWAQTQKRIGRGTGKRAPALQAEARRLLVKARDAVPVWIMPLARVAESFDATKPKFDVVIVDEASQSDVTGLLAWYLGERVAIVGDHEQVSPLAVGQQLDVVTNLIAQHLTGVPNNHLYDGQLSIYELARQSFGETIALREHFRCVPDIIDFSNHLSYNGEIRPLRDPTRVARPHVVEHVVSDTAIGGRPHTNLAEARTVVAIMKALSELPKNKGRTMGAIALVGDEQAGLIQELALDVLGAAELERRRFAAGNAAQFQGDERDIMLLSMVDTPTGGTLAIRQTDVFKQRYNVAASRAKDQLWLVHSLDPNRDLQASDLRRRLIEHVRDPAARRGAIQLAQARAESPFEKSMLQRLFSAGYRAQPQVWVGQYRIDIVVSDDKAQVALECDGDRFHGVDQIPLDMARQAVLERAGWRFVRVRGTRYYRDQEGTMEWVCGQLEKLGVKPAPVSPAAGASGPVVSEFREAIVRRAAEVMRDHGW